MDTALTVKELVMLIEPSEEAVERLVESIGKKCVGEGQEVDDYKVARYFLSLLAPVVEALEKCAEGAFVVQERDGLKNVAKEALSTLKKAGLGECKISTDSCFYGSRR